MGKKKSPPSRPQGRPEFRESDFAGMPPNDQAQLSGSLNHLSEQLAATRLLLQKIEREPLPATPGIGSGDGESPTPP